MIIIFWMSVCIIAVVSELVFRNLVSIWIAIGAFFTSITSIFTNNFYIYLLVFSLTSIIFMIVGKKVIKKTIIKKGLEETREFNFDIKEWKGV